MTSKSFDTQLVVAKASENNWHNTDDRLPLGGVSVEMWHLISRNAFGNVRSECMVVSEGIRLNDCPSSKLG